MNFETRLSIVLDEVKKLPAWDSASAYSAKDPDRVTFHNGFRYAANVRRDVIEDVAKSGMRATIRGLAESITSKAAGTEQAKLLVPHGVDPDHDEPILMSWDLWHGRNFEEQENMLKESGKPILLVASDPLDAAAKAVVHNPPSDTKELPEAHGPIMSDTPAARLPADSPFRGFIGKNPQHVDQAALAGQPCQPPAMMNQGSVREVEITETTADLNDDEAAFIVRQNLECCVRIMKKRTPFNASIGYVREALKVCPKPPEKV